MLTEYTAFYSKNMYILFPNDIQPHIRARTDPCPQTLKPTRIVTYET